MRKVSEFIKPYISIVFGVLLLLFYLNWLSYEGGALAIGIIAIALSAYYVASGLLGVLLGDKLPKGLRKAFDICTIVLFPTFMFIYFLIMTVNIAENMGPAGWLIIILSMSASIAFACMFTVAKVVNNKVISRLALMFAAIFALALLLNILFDSVGNPIALGAINIIALVIYGIFTYMMFNSLALSASKEEPKQVE